MRKVASPATPTAPFATLPRGGHYDYAHVYTDISVSERQGERMCEASQGGQSRQAFILALLRDAREGRGGRRVRQTAL